MGAVPPAGRPLLVAVDGADGSGKTWFADDLAAVLAGRDRPVVRASVDDFHFPRAHRHARGRTGETVWLRSFDYRTLRRLLLDPWRDGAGSAYRRRWHDLATDAWWQEEPEVVPEAGVLLVDGVFVQRAELGDCWDAVVWLEVSDEERVRRMAERDGVPPDPGHPDQARYLEAQRIYRQAADPVGSADVVVDNTDPGAPFVVDVAVPPGWHRTPHGWRRVVTTQDPRIAARINRLLS